MDFIISAVLVLGAIALVASVVLYACSKKFAVEEDPRIDQVLDVLSGANCGGCGFAAVSYTQLTLPMNRQRCRYVVGVAYETQSREH